MADERNSLPSDQEDGGSNPQTDTKSDPATTPPTDSKKVQEDPSEQPS